MATPKPTACEEEGLVVPDAGASAKDQMSTQTIAAFDMETRFRTLAASGDAAQALAILDHLDQQDAKATPARATRKR
ncbi:hypothetical protein [Hydrogenophaga electricum]|nr:hypothetical protein [Hydrogenophaga electricum]